MSEHVVPMEEHKRVVVAGAVLRRTVGEMGAALTELIEKTWPLLDKERAELAAAIWRKWHGPAKPLPGPMPGVLVVRA